MLKVIDYKIHEVTDYIHWMYFFHAWGFQPHYASIHKIDNCPTCRANWVANFPEAQREKAEEAAKLYIDAQAMLRTMDTRWQTHGKFMLLKAWGEQDNIYIAAQPETQDKEHVIPCLRQQVADKDCDYFLCLSDFLHERNRNSNDALDTLGAFCTTVDVAMEQSFDEEDPYNRMLVQTLCDRLAEATAERLHKDIRTRYWGYAPEENLTPEECFAEKYQGIRPAAGYPSLPDLSINHVIDGFLNMGEIGISLTENGMMYPHASVSGLLFAHPEVRYFNIGRIDEEQLEDYALRRGLPAHEIRRYLIANL
ncbi:MAG: vitamin B12 dependent-methionine synthase activation domain-containing protein [Bacteroidales bacterium]|nr:vitamin B12 dependent-methionine synthase activation domain-containing protein [Bacteroidales bacterium]